MNAGHNRMQLRVKHSRIQRRFGGRVSLLTHASSDTYQPLPRNVNEMVNTAAQSIINAESNRHLIQLINPVNEKAKNFNSTEAQDYPESTFSEFNTLVSVTKQLISGLSGISTDELNTKRIDEGGIDGDLCCVVNTPDLSFAAVVWPTAGRLKQLKTLADNKRIGTLIIVNALWKTEGQLMSEFGIGPWRVENEKFIATFVMSYALYEQRIGSPSSVNLARGSRYESGGVIRVQRCYPSGFEAHLMAPNGSSQALGTFDASGGKPSYQALDKLITAGREAKLEIFDVARAASRLELERGGQQDSDMGSSEFHSREEVLNMDLSKLRRVLSSLSLPTSGSLSKLQSRALAVADAVESGLDLEAGVEAAKVLR